MNDEKDGVDDLMSNIITGGLKKGNDKLCFMDNNKIYIDYQNKGQGQFKQDAHNYIDDFLTNACSHILDNQSVAFADKDQQDYQEGGVIN